MSTNCQNNAVEDCCYCDEAGSYTDCTSQHKKTIYYCHKCKNENPTVISEKKGKLIEYKCINCGITYSIALEQAQ